MSDGSAIEWTDATWNPLVGCSRVSPGCVNCYAERHAHRFSGVPDSIYFGTTRVVNGHPTWNGTIRVNEKALAQPLGWRRPRRIFVNSMSDLFHENVPLPVIDRVVVVMALAWWHTFQILTKRAALMRDYFAGLTYERLIESCRGPDGISLIPRHTMQSLMHRFGFCPDSPLQFRRVGPMPLPNVWLGVSVENQDAADERIPLLLETPAAMRFLSCEPLLGPVCLWPSAFLPCPRYEYARQCPETGAWECCNSCDHTGVGNECGVDWVIVGGESGPGARPFDVAWARMIVEDCRTSNVACFVKQLGAHVRHNGCSSPGEHWPRGTMGDRDTGEGDWRKHLIDRKGGDPAEWPEDLRVREFPRAVA